MDPGRVLWTTPREWQAAKEGYRRRLRMEHVFDPMSDFDTERDARRFIEGENVSAGLSHEEQERKLEALKERTES
jgi:hypothetical protein